MVKEARELSKIHSNIVIKIPITEEGLKAVKILSAEGIKTNVTLIFSANQALLAARAGATYVSPFLGRLDDISQRGVDLIREISDIFAEDGEEVFRALETKVLTELGKRSGLVIATGGGCVTKECNYPLLHQNGTIFYLQRDPDKLPIDGRPLSQAGDLARMYETRRPMYEAFADHEIDNNGSIADTLRSIGELL